MAGSAPPCPSLDPGDTGLDSGPLDALTNREREILKLLAEGLTYQEIGEIRGNSGLTVRNAVPGIQKKLWFKTRQQLVVWAVRIGLVDDELLWKG